MKEILSIKNLRKHFPVKNAWGTDVALVKALDGVDLKIESGKTFGVVGESGCGKSSIGKVLIGLINNEEKTNFGVEALSGVLTFKHMNNNINYLDTSYNNLRSLRKNVQMIN